MPLDDHFQRPWQRVQQCAEFLAGRESPTGYFEHAVADFESGESRRRQRNHLAKEDRARLGRVVAPNHANPHRFAIERYGQRFRLGLPRSQHREFQLVRRRENRHAEPIFVVDRPLIVLQDSIANPQSHFGRWRVLLDKRDHGAFRPFPTGAKSRRPNRNRLLQRFLFNGRLAARLRPERWQTWSIRHVARQPEGQSRDPLDTVRHNSLDVVARTVVVVVQSGVKHDDGNAAGEKRMMVAVGFQFPGEVEQ